MKFIDILEIRLGTPPSRRANQESFDWRAVTSSKALSVRQDTATLSLSPHVIGRRYVLLSPFTPPSTPSTTSDLCPTFN